MRRHFFFLRVLAVAAGGGLLSWTGAQEPVPADKPQAGSSPSAVAYINSMAALDDKRKLAIGDRLSFRVVEDRRPPVPMIVTDSGEVEVPFIGRVAALNKTCKELAEEIKVPMEKDYFYKATVIVALDISSEKSLGKVYITGNVRNPGPLEITPDETLTVSRAILRAGGFDPYANKHHIKLIRKDPGSPSGTDTTILDVGEIIEKGDSNKDMAVQPDDMIVVPRAIINL
jgi:protein involved in polysaccharide export with SLBB domain